MAPAVPAARGVTKRTQYRICEGSFELDYIRVAEGSILRDLEET
jgi:hypothetical protein